ncbi:MAG: type II secretion system protein N [Candidatus Thiodiazotropha endolucinida]
MNNWKHSFNVMTLLLLLTIGAMGGYLYYQWRSPVGYASPAMERMADQDNSRTSDGKAGTTRFVPVSLTAYDEITERPLFVEGRLPPAEPEQKSNVTRIPRKPLRLKLEGVAMMPDNKVAIIRDLDTNELLRVSQGMNKNDWKVESVDSNSAIITRKGERLVLKLEIDDTSVNKRKLPLRKLPFRPSNR